MQLGTVSGLWLRGRSWWFKIYSRWSTAFLDVHTSVPISWMCKQTSVSHSSTAFDSTNEVIRERIEEDMDFKIPGLPHSTVTQLHGASVRDLIQKIENHPNRHALQRDLQQSQSFYPFNSWSWKHRIVWTTRYGTQSTVQCVLIILGRRHHLLHVRALLAERNGGEQEICPVHSRSPLDSQLLHQERATPRAPLRGGSRVLQFELA